MEAIALAAVKAFWPYILAIIAVLGWGFHQRLSGAKAERQKQAADNAKARDIADEVQNDVGSIPADAARKELSTWDM